MGSVSSTSVSSTPTSTAPGAVPTEVFRPLRIESGEGQAINGELVPSFVRKGCLMFAMQRVQPPKMLHPSTYRDDEACSKLVDEDTRRFAREFVRAHWLCMHEMYAPKNK